MQAKIRHFIRSSPLLYWVWLLVKYGYPHKLPGVDADLHVDGFQRSGNTFSTTLLRNLFPEKKIVSHFHAVASLKLAIKYDIPTIVVVRDPKEAIASSIVKRVLGRGQPRGRSVTFDLEGYTDYYEFVLKNKDFFDVKFFDDFIKSPEVLVRSASDHMNTELPNEVAIKIATRDVVDFLKSDDRPAALHSLGSPEKAKLKEAVLDEIQASPQFLRANETYKAMKQVFKAN